MKSCVSKEHLHAERSVTVEWPSAQVVWQWQTDDPEFGYWQYYSFKIKSKA